MKRYAELAGNCKNRRIKSRWDNKLGSTTLTFNISDGVATEIETLISDYNTGMEDGNKGTWFVVWSPFLTKSFFFKGEPPQKIGMPEIGVNTVMQVEVPITVSDYHGLDTAVEPAMQ